LLQEIGVDDTILQIDVYRGFLSYRIKSAFVDVGLLPPSALKDPAAEAATTAAAKARTESEEGS
jgi:hypothetical protein